jgi:hypothetical protein
MTQIVIEEVIQRQSALILQQIENHAHKVGKTVHSPVRDYQKINNPNVERASCPPSVKERARCPFHLEGFWDIFLFASPLVYRNKLNNSTLRDFGIFFYLQVP